MSEVVSAAPDPDRVALARSMWEPASFRVVTDAISVASSDGQRLFYLERLDEGWCWALAHRGGPYPLLRVMARFLKADYRKLTVGFRTIEGNVAVLGAYGPPPSRGWWLVELPDRSTPAQVRAHVRRLFSD